MTPFVSHRCGQAFQVPVGMQDVSLKDKEDGTAADDEKEPNTTMVRLCFRCFVTIPTTTCIA